MRQPLRGCRINIKSPGYPGLFFCLQG
jgi:hypothetical protein